MLMVGRGTSPVAGISQTANKWQLFLAPLLSLHLSAPSKVSSSKDFCRPFSSFLEDVCFLKLGLSHFLSLLASTGKDVGLLSQSLNSSHMWERTATRQVMVLSSRMRARGQCAGLLRCLGRGSALDGIGGMSQRRPPLGSWQPVWPGVVPYLSERPNLTGLSGVPARVGRAPVYASPLWRKAGQEPFSSLWDPKAQRSYVTCLRPLSIVSGDEQLESRHSRCQSPEHRRPHPASWQRKGLSP